MYNMSQGSGCGCGYVSSDSSGCGYFKSNCRNNAGLEALTDSAVNYSKQEIQAPAQSYSFSAISHPILAYHPDLSSAPKNYSSPNNAYQLFSSQKNYDFVPDSFLRPGKLGMFVGKAEEVREFVEEGFELMFHEKFPDDIKISVLDDEQFQKLAPHAGTLGLSINRRRFGLMSEIFVRNDFLGRVMLTIGHELGHVLTPTLESKHDEEAKAYAFSLAWIKAIKQNDIGGLREAIVTETPAHNGLHDVAFSFVEKMVRAGKESWDVYLDMVEKKVCCSVAA